MINSLTKPRRAEHGFQRLEQCDQIGHCLNVRDNKYFRKSRPKYLVSYRLFWKTSFLCKNFRGHLLGIWTFKSNIWSHGLGYIWEIEFIQFNNSTKSLETLAKKNGGPRYHWISHLLNCIHCGGGSVYLLSSGLSWQTEYNFFHIFKNVSLKQLTKCSKCILVSTYQWHLLNALWSETWDLDRHQGKGKF